ncbi:hypothetical protein B0H66DRAFT_296168 [Apodospora peruviana]|uniref:Uncharacterized protein n=1 Tax=Apodospora peruviana TaxID=516989 RepID=A0AAE0I0V6_9PEZI|nr:hypothetical protein B0H66DRAFT_296168 [Apodospora peruviana]
MGTFPLQLAALSWPSSLSVAHKQTLSDWPRHTWRDPCSTPLKAERPSTVRFAGVSCLTFFQSSLGPSQLTPPWLAARYGKHGSLG